MSDPDVPSRLDEIIREHSKRVSDAIETACEAALQGGLYGVLVTYYPNLRVVAQVSPHVPYGHIYHHWKDC